MARGVELVEEQGAECKPMFARLLTIEAPVDGLSGAQFDVLELLSSKFVVDLFLEKSLVVSIQ